MTIINEREAAVSALLGITSGKRFSDEALRKCFTGNPGLTAGQKAFIIETVKGVLRNMMLIDHIIASNSNTHIDKIDPIVLNILRMTVYQLKFMNGVPAYAACNEGVNMVKKHTNKRLAPFANGVIRGIIRNMDSDYTKESDPLKRLSLAYSHPEWLVSRWIKTYGTETAENICRANNMTPDISIVVNLLKTTSDKLVTLLTEEGANVSPGILDENSLRVTNINIESSKAFKSGLFHVMDESSMLSVRALDPKPGETVIDICAAPGGKSLYCGYLMENKGIIHSWDINKRKINMLEQSARRLGINIISTLQMNAEVTNNEFVGTADKLIVDAPCSGLGVIRKKPEIKYTKTSEDIKYLAELQREILNAVWDYTKPGGILVYSTCTITEEENDLNAKWFTDNYPYHLINMKQLLPTDKNDGFFIAVFKRTN